MIIKEYIFNDLKYSIQISKKKIKNIYLKISADNEIKLSAPSYFSDKKIDEFIYSKKEWIKKHYNPNFDKNETKIFGTRFDILINITLKDEKVLIINNQLNLFVNKIENKDKILDEYYKSELIKLIGKYTKRYSEMMELDFEHTFKLKSMKSLWGVNHYNKKEIVYNLKLIHIKKEFVEYVVAHELSHFTHQNHSKNFYNYLSEYVPDYKEKRKISNKHS